MSQAEDRHGSLSILGPCNFRSVLVPAERVFGKLIWTFCDTERRRFSVIPLCCSSYRLLLELFLLSEKSVSSFWFFLCFSFPPPRSVGFYLPLAGLYYHSSSDSTDEWSDFCIFFGRGRVICILLLSSYFLPSLAPPRFLLPHDNKRWYMRPG